MTDLAVVASCHHLALREEVGTITDVVLPQENGAGGDIERLECRGEALEADRSQPAEDGVRTEELEILGRRLGGFGSSAQQRGESYRDEDPARGKERCSRTCDAATSGRATPRSDRQSTDRLVDAIDACERIVGERNRCNGVAAE
jgi:hypothetical protein